MNIKFIILAVFIVVALFGIIYWFFPMEPQPIVGKYDNFAKCLASKNITMYGAAWCSHCQNQKNMFGDSFEYVPYVECSDEPQKCIDAGVTSIPMWSFPGGRQLIGEQTFEKLSEVSNCPL
jgi:hypothetical protein